MSKRIENDEAYKRSLQWLVKKAGELEDPLLALDPEKKAVEQKKYDYVADAIQRYRRGQLVKQFPGLREQYAVLGWAFDEPAPKQAPEQKAEDPRPPETVTAAADMPPQPKPAAALAGWLDDD